MAALHSLSARACVLMVAVVLSWSSGALAAEDPEPLYGRISALEGELMIKGAEEDEWSYVELNGIVADGDSLLTEDESHAEIEMPGQVFLRLGESAGMDVLSVREGRYRLWKGSVYAALADVPDRVAAVETPACAVVLMDEALARIDVEAGGAVRVHSLRGEIEVLGAGESSVEMDPNLTLGVSPEGSFIALGAMTEVLTDSLAQWHVAREAYLAGHALPESAPADVVGARELADSGEWVTEDDVEYWRPRVEPSWRPYYVGTWHHLTPVGWYWVPRHSFEYVTCHYGYWRFSSRRGWLWRPCWRWRPARVAWAVHDDGIFWAPIDYHHRPVLVHSPGHVSVRISIGDDFRLSWGAWCFASFGHFHADSPRYTIVKPKTTIKVRVVANIDHVTVIRPARNRRGRRELPRLSHLRLREILRHKPMARKFEADHRRGHGRVTARLDDLRGRRSGREEPSEARSAGPDRRRSVERTVRLRDRLRERRLGERDRERPAMARTAVRERVRTEKPGVNAGSAEAGERAAARRAETRTLVRRTERGRDSAAEGKSATRESEDRLRSQIQARLRERRSQAVDGGALKEKARARTGSREAERQGKSAEAVSKDELRVQILARLAERRNQTAGADAPSAVREPARSKPDTRRHSGSSSLRRASDGRDSRAAFLARLKATAAERRSVQTGRPDARETGRRTSSGRLSLGKIRSADRSSRRSSSARRSMAGRGLRSSRPLTERPDEDD